MEEIPELTSYVLHLMSHQKTILLISPYWKEDHRWMVSFGAESKPAVFLPRTILSLYGAAPAMGPARPIASPPFSLL
jgi:hypothetical protein